MEHLKDLASNERYWLMLAVTHILLADGGVEDTEKTYLKALIKTIFSEDIKVVFSEISELFRSKKLPSLEKIQVPDLENVIFMLDVLARSVFVNGKKPESQTSKYFEAGKALGIHIGTLSYRLSLEAEKFRVDRKLEQVRKDIKEDRQRTMPVN
ncbi:MAG: hypothetical protein QNL04_01440 [SAR324 cluster bacterium]|nr:hypothetical protein [SAR324 cluster bacterium]